MIADLLQILTSTILGLFAGSLLTAGMILVPYWRSMEPATFLQLHGMLGPRLYKFYAPLTIAATLIPTFTFAFCLSIRSPTWVYLAVAALLMQAILGIYFYYFKYANASFASATVGVDGLPYELRRWSNWHWLRTTIGFAAFLVSLVALLEA